MFGLPRPAVPSYPSPTPAVARFLLVLGCLTATGAVAQVPCSTVNANTGQPGWKLVSGPGFTTPKAPVAVKPYAGWGVLPNAQWISVDANHGTLAGDYAYEYQFMSCPCRAQGVNLTYFADNRATVSLNGAVIDTGSGNTNFKGAPRTMSYNQPFVKGTNKLRIVVHNENHVTGLNAMLTINGATTNGQCPCTTTLTTATGQPGWMLTSGPGVTAPRTPISVSPYAGWGLLPGSSWVSVDANRGNSPGNYTYEYAFCKCGDGPMALQMYADNGATVSLNNAGQIFASKGDSNFKNTPLPVNYSGAFAPGNNKLRITVRNDGSVTGLDAVLTVGGATAGVCPTGVLRPDSASSTL